MHAYLIVGDDLSTRREADILAKSLKVSLLEFPLSKIEDVRQLGSFVSLSLENPTAIYASGVDKATGEAMNAFLKNLEEPQEGLYYILTAESIGAVLPTIVSRCQVIVRSAGNRAEDSVIDSAKNFLEAGIGEKLAHISEIKDRDAALAFVTELIIGYHGLMLKTENTYTIYSRTIREATFCKKALEGNGNVTIQLTNLVSSLV